MGLGTGISCSSFFRVKQSYFLRGGKFREHIFFYNSGLSLGTYNRFDVNRTIVCIQAQYCENPARVLGPQSEASSPNSLLAPGPGPTAISFGVLQFRFQSIWFFFCDLLVSENCDNCFRRIVTRKFHFLRSPIFIAFFI